VVAVAAVSNSSLSSTSVPSSPCTFDNDSDLEDNAALELPFFHQLLVAKGMFPMVLLLVLFTLLLLPLLLLFALILLAATKSGGTGDGDRDASGDDDNECGPNFNRLLLMPLPLPPMLSLSPSLRFVVGAISV